MLTDDQRLALVEALEKGEWRIGETPNGLTPDMIAWPNCDDTETLTWQMSLLAAEIKAHEETRRELAAVRADAEGHEITRLAEENDTLRAQLDECREVLEAVDTLDPVLLETAERRAKGNDHA